MARRARHCRRFLVRPYCEGAVRASDEVLLATTLASQVAADPKARVSVIGLDAARARLFAGTRDADVYAMDEQGQLCCAVKRRTGWRSSIRAYRPEKLRNTKWMAVGAAPNVPPLRTLVFDEKHPEQFAALYKSSPFAQDAQFDLLNEVIARDLPGQGSGFHFVCLLAGPLPAWATKPARSRT